MHISIYTIRAGLCIYTMILSDTLQLLSAFVAAMGMVVLALYLEDMDLRTSFVETTKDLGRAIGIVKKKNRVGAIELSLEQSSLDLSWNITRFLKSN